MPLSWILLLTAFLVLRLIFWLTAFPNPDEAYYWLWGQHPALSYYDHPPLQAWIQGAFTDLFGRSPFILRLPNLISNSLLFGTYYSIVRYLYKERFSQAFWLMVLLILASPLYFLFLGLAWSDHWLITFTLISAYGLITFLDGYLKDGRGVSWRLYGSAIALGLAGLCKYSALFVGLGFAATLVADRRLHPLWRDRRLYGAIAIVGSAFIPIFIWNLTNDFQSVHFYVSRSISGGDFSLKWAPCFNFLLFSFLLVSPANWIGFYKSWRQSSALIEANSIYTTVTFWVFIVSTVALIIISLLSAALYYWNITAYLLLFPLLPGVFLQSPPALNTAIASSPPAHLRLKQRWLFWGGQFYGLLFAGLMVMQLSFLPPSALANLDVDPDSRILFGWDEVATVVQQQAAALGESVFLVTTDYRSASALAYQLNQPNVAVISDRIDQFDLWHPNNREFAGRNAVILADDWHPITPALLAQFDHTTTPMAISIKRLGIWIKNYYVLQGYRFQPSSRPSLSKF